MESGNQIFEAPIDPAGLHSRSDTASCVSRVVERIFTGKFEAIRAPEAARLLQPVSSSRRKMLSDKKMLR